MGFGMTPRQYGIHLKPHPLLQKTCLSYPSDTQECACVRMLWLAYVGRDPRT